MIDELVQILGQEKSLKLIQRFGGTALYIPHNPPDDHPVILVLGSDAAKKLASYYGGENLYLPLGRKWLREQQRQLIHQLKRQKMPTNQIAKTVGCTARWVRMVIKDHPEKPMKNSPFLIRNISIYTDSKNGAKVTVLSKKYNLSKTRIGQIIAATKRYLKENQYDQPKTNQKRP